MAFGYDGNGIYKPLNDGRVLRVRQQMFNSIVTLSASQGTEGGSMAGDIGAKKTP